MAPKSNRPFCSEVQQHVTSLCVSDYRLPILGSSCTQSILGRPGPTCLSISSCSGQSGGETNGILLQENHSDCNMSWFLDLVAMSSHIPLCLPTLTNLQTQPFNQIPHKNLSNLNFHMWLLESPRSRREQGSGSKNGGSHRVSPRLEYEAKWTIFT